MHKTIFLFGGGLLPKLILKKINIKKCDFYVLFLENKNIKYKLPNFKNVNLGETLTELKKLKKKGYSKILLAGSIKRPKLSEIKPDLNSLKLIPKFTQIFLKGGDDKLLRFVIKEFENLGLRVLYLHKMFPEFFLGLGSQIKKNISKNFLEDISRGVSILKSNSKFDIGQSLVIQEGTVIGMEAAQGTDNLIKQSQPYLKGVCNGILIKLVKVNQDLRADLPTIGLKTLKNCYICGIRGVVYSANKTIFINKEAIFSFCKKNNIFLYGV